MRRVSRLVKERLRQKPVVVVSALAKVTDQLLAAGLAAAEGRREVILEAVQRLRQRHEQIAAELMERGNYDRLRNDLEVEFQSLDKALCNIAAEGQFSPRAQDNLLGRGESLSSHIVQAALRKDGLDAVLLDAKQCIITDAAHTCATPLWDETNERLKAALLSATRGWQCARARRLCGLDPGRCPNHSRPRRIGLQRCNRRRRTARNPD